MARKQKTWHIITEALGVLQGLLLIYFSFQVAPAIGWWLFIMGWTTLIVDVYFITTWR